MVSLFKTRVRLETQIVMLRHQLNVLCRRVPAKPKLGTGDRVLFALSAVPGSVVRCCQFQARDDRPIASHGVPPALALEVGFSWRKVILRRRRWREIAEKFLLR